MVLGNCANWFGYCDADQQSDLFYSEVIIFLETGNVCHRSKIFKRIQAILNHFLHPDKVNLFGVDGWDYLNFGNPNQAIEIAWNLGFEKVFLKNLEICEAQNLTCTIMALKMWYYKNWNIHHYFLKEKYFRQQWIFNTSTLNCITIYLFFASHQCSNLDNNLL